MEKVAGSIPASRTIAAINMAMDSRESLFQRMCARVGELPEKAIAALQDGRRYYAVMVVVPHHDFRKKFSEFVRDAFLDAGFAVDKTNSSMVVGEEFAVWISTISHFAGKGRSLDAVYFPAEGLTPSQASTMKSLRESLIPTITPHGGEVIDY